MEKKNISFSPSHAHVGQKRTPTTRHATDGTKVPGNEFGIFMTSEHTSKQSKFHKDGFHGGEVNNVCLKKNDLKTVNKRTFAKVNIMGTGASTSSREWTVADEDNATVEDVRPRTAANANLPANDGMTGMTKVVEAKNRFLKIKNKEKNTACFQKQVVTWV